MILVTKYTAIEFYRVTFSRNQCVNLQTSQINSPSTMVKTMTTQKCKYEVLLMTINLHTSVKMIQVWSGKALNHDAPCKHDCCLVLIRNEWPFTHQGVWKNLPLLQMMYGKCLPGGKPYEIWPFSWAMLRNRWYSGLWADIIGRTI